MLIFSEFWGWSGVCGLAGLLGGGWVVWWGHARGSRVPLLAAWATSVSRRLWLRPGDLQRSSKPHGSDDARLAVS